MAFLASVLPLVAARTAAARPMKRGDNREGDSCLTAELAGVDGAVKADAPERSAIAKQAYFMVTKYLFCVRCDELDGLMIDEMSMQRDAMVKTYVSQIELQQCCQHKCSVAREMRIEEPDFNTHSSEAVRLTIYAKTEAHNILEHIITLKHN